VGVNENEAKVRLRLELTSLAEIAQAVCRPEHSVTDFVQMLTMALSNEIALEFVMERIAQRAKSEAAAKGNK
jgi:hypothetical protein